jgi:GxxExxY protein
MPVEIPVEIQTIGQRRFHELDTALMGIAFELQNSLGNLCDERIYQSELAYRCDKVGIQCHREVEVRVFHRSFVKSYFLDLLVELGVIYEFKTVRALAPSHHSQLLNYLLLTATHHGKLVNFRTKSVESQFVSTNLSHDERKSYHLSDSNWHETDESFRLKATLIDLLADWGAFLDINLYRDALLHLLNGPESGLFPVAIQLQGRTAGFQNMCLLNSEQAWHLSALKTHLQAHENQIRRLLHHTHLTSIHWINLNHREITLKSLQK